MQLRLPSLAAAFAALAAASPTSTGGGMSIHESIPRIPKGWAAAGSVSPDEEITLRIALAHSDIAGLEKAAYAVSDPANALYGQHLTPEEVAKYVQPTPATLSLVTAWLTSHNITPSRTSPAGDVLGITLPVHAANALLATQFRAFTHTQSKSKSIRTLAYSVPAALRDHILNVHPTVAFVLPPSAERGGRIRRSVAGVGRRQPQHESPSQRAVPASCADTVTPACLQALYGFPVDIANNSAQNIIGVTGFIDEFANEADLNLYLTSLRPDLVGSTFTLTSVDGGTNDQTPSSAGFEADIDIELAVGNGNGVPVTFYSVGSDSTDGLAGFVDITNFILAEPVGTRPTVLSTSYGFDENELTLSLAVEICNAYMQLAAVGISVLFSSGDGGVAGTESTFCTEFVPTAPSMCPFVTSVGGVTGLPPQTAWQFSSGGFSNFLPTPDYQAADVAAYIASLGDEYQGLYNASGRGFPDISLSSEHIQIAWMQVLTQAAGTSCSTPMFAAMVALVNDRLVAAGKPVLGFLNPLLYSDAGKAALTDITSGSNTGCNTNGFSAGTGWDPVSGLGTPNFDALLTAVGL